MNLSPYNYYFLYFSVSLTIITLIYTFLKTISFVKLLYSKKKEMTNIQNNAMQLNDKIKQVNNLFNKIINMLKQTAPFLLYGYLFYKNYKASDEKGAKRIVSGLKTTLNKDIPQIKLEKNIKKLAKAR